ncbi:putative disease resistance protein At3g14460 [Morus notabilis]|uniref:putative disease resistance protein At3g14460 n=1 Tax=Morus notabilis TaxID=981085 RepID=UPI000CED190F|nr:putative disease resistance protein At3g14460 [Morus notabilis]
MAENLLQSIKGKRPEEIGREYIDILISRSLFQKSREGDQCVAMHNLVHDMARFVSAEFSLMLDGSDSQRLVSRTRYLACTNRGINAHDSFMQFQQLVSSENIVLRTFLSLKEPTRDLSKNKLVLPKTSAVKVLRVLSLACYQITSLDSSLANLISIRYLNLSGNGFKEIPDNTITSLPYLQTLLLADCSRLIRLPKDIVSLTHLQISIFMEHQ